MIKAHAFPVKIVLEILDDNKEFTPMLFFVVNDYESLCKKIIILRTLYKTEREYRLIFYVQSKMNKMP